jgi:hypothetical protein
MQSAATMSLYQKARRSNVVRFSSSFCKGVKKNCNATMTSFAKENQREGSFTKVNEERKKSCAKESDVSKENDERRIFNA